MWTRLGDLLLDSRALSRQRLNEILALQREQGGLLGSLLVDLGLVRERDVARALARQHGIPAVCLAGAGIASQVLTLVSRDTLRLHRVLPIRIEGDVLRLAIANPNDRTAILAAARECGMRVKPCVATRTVLERAVFRHTGAQANVPSRESESAGPELILVSEAWSPEGDGEAKSESGDESEDGGDGVAPLIARGHLFSHASVAQVGISPDGKRISFIGAHGNGRAIYVAPVHDVTAAKPIVDDSEISLEWHTWAHSGSHILYRGDREGDELTQLHSIDVRTGQTRHLSRLTGFPRFRARVAARDQRGGVKADARLVALSSERPEEALIQIRPPVGPTRVYRVNLSSGRQNRVRASGVPAAIRFWADSKLELKLCSRYVDGNETLCFRTDRGWHSLLTMPPESLHESRVLGIDATGRFAYLLDGFRENVAHVVRVHLWSGRRQILASPKHCDIEQVVLGPDGVRAVVEFHPRITIRPFTDEFRRELRSLRSVARGAPFVIDSSTSGSLAVVVYANDDRPESYYLYDRGRERARHLFDSRPAISRASFSRMTPVNIRARDGLSLPCYVTLPSWIPAFQDRENGGKRNASRPRRLPTVISVHGGPHARDYWTFDREIQWLANRGYAVVSVNYRGSTGFGKRLEQATPCWIAPEMLEDVEDATRWAIREGIADPKRIAIVGASYGGYLVLQGLLAASDLYACGVDLCGVTNWRSKVGEAWAASAMGTDPYSARALLIARSPVYRAAEIRKPLLVAHGTNDVRVSVEDSNRLTAVLAKHRRPITYLRYSSEGHGFYRRANRLSYYAIVEHFLANHLGGRLESFGSDLEETTLTIPHGAENIPGLESFWKAAKAIERARRRRDRELDLSGYGLRELPPSIGELTSLVTLRLARNFLTALPPSIGGLAGLEDLELQANQLLELPKELGELKALRHLDVCGNQLRTLPEELRELPALRTLVLGGNQLQPGALWGFRPRVLRRS